MVDLPEMAGDVSADAPDVRPDVSADAPDVRPDVDQIRPVDPVRAGSHVSEMPSAPSADVRDVPNRTSADVRDVRMGASGDVRDVTEGRLPDGPHVRLATIPGIPADNCLLGKRGVPRLPERLAPSLLCSYHYYRTCRHVIDEYVHRDWVLDSGAFSAANTGVPIDVDDYIAFCKDIVESDNPPAEIFALDVIGDAEGTRRNTEKMWAAGIEAIPAYHIGEPEKYLYEYAKEYPKIALGGVARLKGNKKHEWAKACFSRVWPKRIHGFGFGQEKDVLGLPFHSTDSTNWELGPCAFGRWKSYGSAGTLVALPVRGSAHDLRGEVEWYLKLEQRARAKWRKQMDELDALADDPKVRLAIVGVAPNRINSAFVKKPTHQ